MIAFVNRTDPLPSSHSHWLQKYRNREINYILVETEAYFVLVGLRKEGYLHSCYQKCKILSIETRFVYKRTLQAEQESIILVSLTENCGL